MKADAQNLDEMGTSCPPIDLVMISNFFFCFADQDTPSGYAWLFYSAVSFKKINHRIAIGIAIWSEIAPQAGPSLEIKSEIKIRTYSAHR